MSDTIFDSYMGLKGEESQSKSQLRINWMVSMAQNAQNILDIGCSQGIASFLLARQGKRVVGVDINPEAVGYADNILLTDEYAELKNNLTFKCFDILNCDLNEVFFDCILMGEILEHLDDPRACLKQAQGLLEPCGIVIITVPFGINDYHDHKTTYYLNEIYNQTSEFFDVISVEYLGNWVGLTATSKGDVKQIFKLDNENIDRLEAAFFSRDRRLTDRITTLKDKVNLLDTKSKKFYDEIIQKKKTMNQMKDEIKQYKDETNQYIEQTSTAVFELGKAISLLNKAETDIKRLNAQNALLKKEINKYQKMFSRITDTWYGKIVLRIYRVLRSAKRLIFNRGQKGINR